MNFQKMQVHPNLNTQQSYDEPTQSSKTSFCADPRLQEELNRFKEIQKNPQLLLQTLLQMKHQQKREAKDTAEMPKKHETIAVDKYNENSLVCYICGKLLRRRSMNAHLDAHNGHTCTIDHCNAVYKSRQGFKRHQVVHHFKQPSCTEKGRIPISSASQVENGKKSYICKVCGRSLTSRRSLLLHLRIHTGEKPERCRLCFKRFRQKSTLRTHSKSCLHKIHAATIPIGSK